MDILFIIFNMIIGASMGSFLNVVATRTEKELPWWGKERSKCPDCEHQLGLADLIPVFSYLFLRGKCRYCGKHINIKYFLVEIAGAFIGGLLSWRWGMSTASLLALITAYGLLLNSMTDLYSGYIYDLFALSIGAAGLFIRIFGGLTPFVDGCLGAASGFALIALIIILSRGGMGWGDASLMAGLGGALGLKMVSVALYLGFMSGGIIAIGLLLTGVVKRKDAIPLGPFLAAGGLFAMLVGPQILSRFGIMPGWPWF